MSAAITVNTAPIPKLASAAGIINLLKEQQIEVKCQAIRTLNSIVDYFWPEIADISSTLYYNILSHPVELLVNREHFAYDASFPERQLAALVLSKVFFHMEKWDESIRLALLSGPLFDIHDGSIFNQTIRTKAIDRYVSDKSAGRPVDTVLEGIVEGMIKVCLGQGDYKQVIGISLDSRRLDVLEATLKVAHPVDEHLRYAQKQVLEHSSYLDFQHQVLELLISTAERQPEVDYFFICDCLVSTHDVPKCSSILAELLNKDPVLALQIAFNIYEIGPEFAQKVSQIFNKISQNTENEKLLTVLSGKVPSSLAVRFLAKANSSDLLILEKSRETLNQNNSQHHSAIYYSNGLMHCGSTCDEFLRKNMEWLSYASNWAKFSAASSLGMIHRGHQESSRTVLAPYLPKPGSTGSPYAEGGALFALGMIHSKSNNIDELAYLKEQLSSSTNEVIQHGACLGIGAIAMASHDASILDDLRGALYADNAVSGEAAALAIGLVMAGSLDAALIEELLSYARETQHEKIIRSLVLAIALISYGGMDKSDSLIDEMLNDKDVIVRFGGIWTTAMAYAGTSDAGALRRLLHAAVSESDDDVRRSAVTGIGFLSFRNPDELPQLLELLSASYNPHVRYGVAMALGIAFAGTANKAALDLVKPMCKDLTDFVRQGAYLSLSLILQQVSEAASDQVAPTRKLFEGVAGNKYEDAIARFGAILSQGLIDAGGRNSALTLASPSSPQHNSLFGICGTMIFCQFWYWYPCISFLSLALEPTGMIAVEPATLNPPAGFNFVSAAPPELFAYPEPTKAVPTAQPKKQATASVVLSTTAKAVARAKKAKGDDMEVDSVTAASPDLSAPVVAAEPTIALAVEPIEESMEESEETLPNFSRITPLQREHIQFPSQEGQRFTPILSPWTAPIITVLRDRTPGQPIDFIETKKKDEKEPAKDQDVDMEQKEQPEQPELVAPPQPFEEPEL